MKTSLFFAPLFAPVLAYAGSDCVMVSDDSLARARHLVVEEEEYLMTRSPMVIVSDSDRKRAVATLEAFQILLRFGTVAPGEYSLPNEGRTKVTADQIKLQRHFNFVDELDSGKTGIDPKYPYGALECWELDMAEALGETASGDDDSPCESALTESQRAKFQALHESMAGFVRVLLKHAALTKRSYRRNDAEIGTWEPCE